MKFYLILIAIFVPRIISAQNEQVNNPINLIENDDQQLLAINNQQKQVYIPNNFQLNSNSFNLPQLSQAKSDGLKIKSGSFSSGPSSGISKISSRHKTINMVSTRGVITHFDKKAKIRHHYKKKNRIKKCASFS